MHAKWKGEEKWNSECGIRNTKYEIRNSLRCEANNQKAKKANVTHR